MNTMFILFSLHFQTTLENVIRSNIAQNATAHFGVTRYSDLTQEEFRTTNLNPTMSHIVKARLKSIQDKPQKNITSSMKVNEIEYKFTDGNDYNQYPSFYKPDLLQQNLNFIPLKIDWCAQFVTSCMIHINLIIKFRNLGEIAMF